MSQVPTTEWAIIRSNIIAQSSLLAPGQRPTQEGVRCHVLFLLQFLPQRLLHLFQLDRVLGKGREEEVTSNQHGLAGQMVCTYHFFFSQFLSENSHLHSFIVLIWKHGQVTHLM